MSNPWMYTDRCSNEYMEGVGSFLRMAKANKRNGFMCCPCRVCRYEKDYSSSKTLHIHLIESGFMCGYNSWTKNGERGVMMEDNKEEDNDDNYHNMSPEYRDSTRMDDNDEAKQKIKHQMSPSMILARPLRMQRKNAKLKR